MPSAPGASQASAAIVPSLVTAFLVLMTVAWLMATPPGSPFDEPAHYVKAIGVGQGELAGRPSVATGEDLRQLYERSARGDAALERLARVARSPSGRWQARTARQFRVTPGLLDGGFGCTVGRSDASAACVDAPHAPIRRRVVGTYTGTYQPYVYVPAGLAIRTADTPATALRLGRAATLAVALALLIAATWLLWSPSAPGTSLVGLVAAVTPMVLFVSSVLSPSGPEIAAAICFSAALLRLGRTEPPPRWLWAALGASGLVLSAARALGPAFVLLTLVSVALLVGPGRFADRLRAGGARAAAAGVAILIGVAASVVWEFTYQPRPSPSDTSVMDAIEPSVRHLPDLAREVIGVFGALDTPMPAAGYTLWLVLLAALALVAFAVGSTRERATVIGLLAAALLVTLVMSVVYREIGPLHGRYALPFLVLVPLWLGELLLRRRARLPARLLTAVAAGAFAVAAAVHLLGWWASGRRFAVGDHGSWLFFGDAEWSPPLGWWPWLLLVAAATAAYLAAAAWSLAGARAGTPAK